MHFRDFLKSNIVCLDGGMGTLLQAKGLCPGEYPEYWNLTHADTVTAIHQSYYDAGSNVVSTNTFGANSLKFSDTELESIIGAAVANVKRARAASHNREEKFIALDIGPTGKLLKPLGELDFTDAVEIFAKTVRLGVRYGVDMILIETMNDSYETKAAVLAAKENSDLPILVSNAYGEDGKLMTGATPEAMVAMLEGLGVDALGTNCSFGPDKLRPVITRLLTNASIPVLLKPNAGLPAVIDGKTVYNIPADEFAGAVTDMVRAGVRLIGGCCGTTPDYIAAVKKAVSTIDPVPVRDKRHTVVSSYTHAVSFENGPVLIGERINPTGKKRFRQALIESDMDYILREGVRQQEKGAHILDVNVGIPDIDEAALLPDAVCALQTVTDLPLQLDTSNPAAMEAALRLYNGKAMINSVNGKQESMDAIFPLAKKYGGVIVALTLDENGIPDTADGRVKIAEKILAVAASYGIAKTDIVFDPLAMTVSADRQAAITTLTALRRIREELGCHTSLGVSNVSFGLPNRDVVNSVFFTMALEEGLSAAIMNPYSAEMRKVYYTCRMLRGMDENCADYITTAASFTAAAESDTQVRQTEESTSLLQYAITKGLRDKSAALTADLLRDTAPLTIVNGEIIPALDAVGKGFEEKKIYLPQLLMSAEAAKSAFAVIKSALQSEHSATVKPPFVIATVKGDIHDIGKNIVRLLLENYGYPVVDLGRDVAPEVVVDAVLQHHAPLVGLSALMTTTVPAMEETIRQLREKAPFCKIVVGGAVLTKEYADRIGADQYAKDAMETVRYAEEVTGKM